MAYFQVQGERAFQMNYDIVPNIVPQTTLFLHGNLASNRWWLPAEQEWKRNAQGVSMKGSLICAEFRGCGQSEAPKSLDDVQMKVLADDFVQLVRSLNSGPVHLVGHSTGGLIAALMLAQAPELFGKAVLLDPVGATGVTFDRSMIAAFDQMKTDKALTSAVIGSTIYNNDPESDFFKQVVVEDAFAAVKTVGHWILEVLDGLDVRADLQKVSNPVLVLHGEHDQLLPMADSKAMAGLFVKGQFKIIPGQGHCTNAENPKLFVSLVQNFLFESN